MSSKYNAASVSRTQQRKKQLAVERFGSKCQLCGYSKCLAALEFHHIGKKKFSPSYIIGRWAWKKATKELKKCVLLCANCHREVEYGIVPPEEVRLHPLPFHLVNCLCCKKAFDTKDELQQFCSNSCRGLYSRKVIRPSKEELQSLIDELPMVQIGKMFSVSDNAVRKWAVSMGCKL